MNENLTGEAERRRWVGPTGSDPRRSAVVRPAKGDAAAWPRRSRAREPTIPAAFDRDETAYHGIRIHDLLRAPCRAAIAHSSAAHVPAALVRSGSTRRRTGRFRDICGSECPRKCVPERRVGASARRSGSRSEPGTRSAGTPARNLCSRLRRWMLNPILRARAHGGFLSLGGRQGDPCATRVDGEGAARSTHDKGERIAEHIEDALVLGLCHGPSYLEVASDEYDTLLANERGALPEWQRGKIGVVSKWSRARQ